MKILNQVITSIAPAAVTNAINGTSIDCSSAGSVAIVSVITPTGASGATVQAFWSLDGTTWVGVGTATACTSNTTFAYNQDRPWFKFVRLQFAIASGSLAVATTAIVNKDS